MPRKVIAWACKFRCGAKVQTSKRRMELHEEKCFLNPLRRSCKTCKHEGFEYPEYHTKWGTIDLGKERVCTLEEDDIEVDLLDREGVEDAEEWSHDAYTRDTSNSHWEIRWNCPGWEHKETEGG